MQQNYINKTLNFVHNNGYNLSASEFLNKASKFLSSLLSVDHVIISKYLLNNPFNVYTLAFYSQQNLRPNITYDLRGTPCENVINKTICYYPDNIQELFPLDTALVKMNAKSYIGIPLFDENRVPIGLITLLNNKPLKDVETIEVILKIFAIKIEKILERIIYEDFLNENNLKYEELSNAIYEGILIHDKGKIKSVNAVLENMFGYSSKELVGANGAELLFPKKHQDFIKINIANKSDGIIEVEGIKKDGSIFPLEIKSKEIQSNNNQTIKFCLFKDITEAKKTEIENTKLLAAVEQSANAIVITDLKGDIEYVNPKFCKTTGYSKSEIIGKNPSILRSGYQSKEFFSNLWNTIKSGETWIGEFQNKNKKGELYWEHATISPIKNFQGEITNYLAIKEDISERKKAEIKLKNAYTTIQEKENYLTRILQTANEGFWIIDVEDITVNVNTKMCAILGIKESEIIGKSIYNFVNKKNAEIFDKEIKNRKLGISSNYEIELINSNGKTTPCLFNTSPVYNKENVVIGSFALVTNISNLKNAYKELEIKHLELLKLTNQLSEKNRLHLEVKDKFKNLFNNSPVSLWEQDFSEVKKLIKDRGIKASNLNKYLDENRDFLIKCVSKINIIRVNKSTFNLMGVKSIEELRVLLKHANTEITYKSLAKEITAVTLNQSEFYGETQFKLADGKLITTIIKSEINTEGVAIVSVIDITSIKNIENQLKIAKIKAEKSDERYRLAVAASGLGIWDWDLSTGHIHYSNLYKKQIGYEPNELENCFDTWKNNLHPDDLEYAISNIENYLKNPIGQHLSEFRLLHKNGSYIWILSTAESLKNEKGEVIRIFGSHRDITLRKKALLKLEKQTVELLKANEKAEESIRLKTEFLNNMSHEVRTPMNAILGFSQFLSDKNLSPEKRNHFVNIIQKSGNQLLRVIDDILEISQLETKQIKVLEKPVCLNDFLMELFSTFDIKAKENQNSLYVEKNLSDKESTIYTDRSKLHKILCNLLENALKFTKKGSIYFGYKLVKNKIELFVKDTGCGINLEHQKIIFERFLQLNNKTTDNPEGLGLGLSIAKENAELLGGIISVESVKSKGSTFKVSIPYKPVNIISKPEHIKEHIKETKPENVILIVEDEEVNYLFIEILVTKIFNSNCKILHARDGLEAVNLCKNNEAINLVLMDINMPIMNGYEATKQIRAFNKDIPIIAQTAYSITGDKEKARLAGCNNFITKPISFDTLQRVIKSYLIIG
jgi:PAS domain S-box-containing protein